MHGRTRIAALAGAGLLLAGVLASAAWAAPEERVDIRAEGGALARGHLPSLALALTVPDGYALGPTRGSWAGPAYRAADGSAAPLPATWQVTLERPRGAIGARSRRGLLHDWPIREGGTVFLSHRVAAGDARTFPAGYVLTTSPAGTAHEAVVVVRLSRRVEALVRFELPAPEGVAALESGEGLAAWNREHALLAIEGVALDGTLPPHRVAASAGARRGAVRGKVTDLYGHPVAGARAVLQRRVGRRWRNVRAASTRDDGRYALRRPARGTYRVVARLAGAEAASKRLVVRR